MEKRESRYKQVFKESISAFREVCFLALGYKVELKGDAASGQQAVFELRSAFDHEAQLVFKYHAGESRLELVPTPYTQRADVAKEVETFVGKFRSVPAFTANLTIERFNQTTLGL